MRESHHRNQILLVGELKREVIRFSVNLNDLSVAADRWFPWVTNLYGRLVGSAKDIKFLINFIKKGGI